MQWHTFVDSWSMQRKGHIEYSAKIKQFARKLSDGRDTTVADPEFSKGGGGSKTPRAKRAAKNSVGHAHFGYKLHGGKIEELKMISVFL